MTKPFVRSIVISTGTKVTITDRAKCTIEQLEEFLETLASFTDDPANVDLKEFHNFIESEFEGNDKIINKFKKVVFETKVVHREVDIIS